MDGRRRRGGDSRPDRTRLCPTCSDDAPIERFDLSVRRDDGERQFFGLLAALCRSCGRFLLDPDAVRLYGIGELDITSAILSDRYLRPIAGADLA